MTVEVTRPTWSSFSTFLTQTVVLKAHIHTSTNKKHATQLSCHVTNRHHLRLTVERREVLLRVLRFSPNSIIPPLLCFIHLPTPVYNRSNWQGHYIKHFPLFWYKADRFFTRNNCLREANLWIFLSVTMVSYFVSKQGWNHAGRAG